MKQHIFALIAALGLSACTTAPNKPTNGAAEQQVQTGRAAVSSLDRPMYLRGDFTLWDADEVYRLKQTQTGLYSVRVRFMSPGKVYEFKIADAKWTPGYNCGFRYDGKVSLGKPLAADCDTVYNYFGFMPDRKGWYRIALDVRGEVPQLIVQRD
ncbi:hypothetical protein [Pseudoalteromonas rubra]|uniref:hypothetical protein n=1 Tax=Pseudoalteromonas rubra TaxID=43658 RepID=UPI000F77BA6C|nr:hypothetical protein [Pseudoalteromonas rubra]